QMGVELPGDAPDYEITNAIFEKTIEATLIQPTFITHLPAELVVLAKPNKQDASVVDVFELVINGQEIAPAYSELNDPVVQRERLLHQAQGHAEKLDEDFLGVPLRLVQQALALEDRKSTRLNSSHVEISYAVFCLKKKKKQK